MRCNAPPAARPPATEMHHTYLYARYKTKQRFRSKISHVLLQNRNRRAHPSPGPLPPLPLAGGAPSPGLPASGERGNAGSSFLCPPPPPALAERRKTRAPEDPLPPGEGRVRGRFRLRKRRAKPRQPPVAPREPPPGLPRKRGRRRKEQARGKEQGRQTHRTQADMRCANPVGGGERCSAQKKAGRPKAARKRVPVRGRIRSRA